MKKLLFATFILSLMIHLSNVAGDLPAAPGGPRLQRPKAPPLPALPVVQLKIPANFQGKISTKYQLREAKDISFNAGQEIKIPMEKDGKLLENVEFNFDPSIDKLDLDMRYPEKYKNKEVLVIGTYDIEGAPHDAGFIRKISSPLKRDISPSGGRKMKNLGLSFSYKQN